MVRAAKTNIGSSDRLSRHVFSPSIYSITTTFGFFQGRIPHVR